MKYYFRLMKEDGYINMTTVDNSILIELKHPRKWRKNTSNFSWGDGAIVDTKLYVPIPSEIGPSDPLEGYILESVQIGQDTLLAHIRKNIDANVLAWCVSSIECNEDEIQNHIQLESQKRNYGSHYMYFSEKSGVFEDLAMKLSQTENSSLMFSAVLRAFYFDNNSTPSIDRPWAYGPWINIRGMQIPMIGVQITGSEKFEIEDPYGKTTINNQICREGQQKLFESRPFKFGPIFSKEDEYRFMLIDQENFEKDQIDLLMENSHGAIIHGKVSDI